MSNKLETAYHEAGHAVAAYYLNRGIKSVTIRPDEERGTLGCVTNNPISLQMKCAIEEARYDAMWGLPINAKTRRYVESDIMICFAGGLVHQLLTSKKEHEVGAGLVEVGYETAQKFAEKFDVTPDEFSYMIRGGDLHDAGDLAHRVTGSGEEEAAYLKWLKERTKNLIRKRGFIESVKALALVLLEKESISGNEVRQIITSMLTSFHRNLLDGRPGANDRVEAN